MRAMIRSTLLLVAGFVLAACAMQPSSPTAPSAIRTELAPSGTLRAGINLGNPVIAQKDPAGGAPHGVGPDLARAFAKRLGVPIAYVTYDTAGKLADGAKQDAWDVAFLAIDPERAADIAFTAPYVQIEGTYLVRKDSPLKAIGEVDRKGIRVAVGNKTAYDLFLTRNLKNAELVRSPTSLTAVEQFVNDKLDAAAGVKQPLVWAAQKNPGLRVMDGNFMVIRQAAGVPRAREAGARYFNDFIEEMKASGFVARALDKSGNGDVTVPPPGR
jgi:polar amino acid transport system substrate-binding protein